MNKELEDAIKYLKNLVSLFYEFPNPQSISIKDSEIKNVETVLNYIENSISKDVIEKKIEELEDKICGDDEYLGNRQCIELELLRKVKKELLERK